VDRSILAPAALLALLALAPARTAAARPLAVLAPEIAGARRPSRTERVALADAVAESLARAGQEVLGGGETWARLEVLDPAQLGCDAAPCGGHVATLLGARGVVLVRPALTGASLRLELLAVDAQGEVLGREQGEATIADWEDALALGRVVAGRLALVLRGPSPQRTSTTEAPSGTGAAGAVATTITAPPSPPPRPRVATHVGEAAIGGGLAVVGGLVGAFAIAALTEGRQCLAGDPGVCSPASDVPVSMAGEFSTPSPLNYVWLAVGGVSVVVGGVLVIHGLMPRPVAPVATGTRVVALPTHDGAVLTVGGTF
jgi:hypothetical protein